MNYRADKHIFELSEAEWNDCREAIAERDALLEDNERLHAKLATGEDELDQQKKYTKSAVEYAEMMDDADTATNEMVDKLQAEIAAIRPNWKDAPEWATHLASDEGTGWVWWKGGPHQTTTTIRDHAGTFGGWQLDNTIGYITDETGWIARIPNWRDTLEARPTEDS